MAFSTLKQHLFNGEIAIRSLVSRYTHRSPRYSKSGVVDIFLCVVDHYEPQVGKPGRDISRRRVNQWLDRYPQMAMQHRDFDGHVPPHSFFYPWDEYDAWELDQLSALCRAGYGEVDLHLHHCDDTEDSLIEKLSEGLKVFKSHGLLSQWSDGSPAWGFIHGNWALANSRFENGHNFCGVNNEVAILQQLGCYADFTFPAWKQTAQPRQVNSIYYALSSADTPKSHDNGVVARVGNTDTQGLLLVQGPLIPFASKTRSIPRLAIDDGDIAASRRYSPDRFDRWIHAGICVQGRPDRVFIKLHSHGAHESNLDVMLGEDLPALYSDAQQRYNDGKNYRLHYVSAREMFNIIKATEAGIEDLEVCRNYLLGPLERTAVQI